MKKNTENGKRKKDKYKDKIYLINESISRGLLSFRLHLYQFIIQMKQK